jgi:hypothetical protein
MEKRFLADEIAGAEERVAVAERFHLFDKMQFAWEIAGGGSVGGLVAGADDKADFVNAGTESFLDDNAERGFLDAIAVHESLQRQRVLIASSGGDDGAFDIHDVVMNLRVSAAWQIPPKWSTALAGKRSQSHEKGGERLVTLKC